MDEDTATRFVSSLVKSIQALCNGYIDFSSSIEVIGHIHLNIDRNKKLDYVLTEEVSKSVSEGATVFASHSYHSHPPPSVSSKTGDASNQNHRKSQVTRDDDPLGISSLPPEMPNTARSHTSNRVEENSDSSQSGSANFSQDSAQIKSENNRTACQVQESLDRRRKGVPLSQKTQSPSAKRPRNNDSGSGSAVQNPGFDVIEIKEEPDDEPSVYFGDNSSSHMASGQDIQTPDFSNVVMESLDRVGQIEGTQLVSGGDSMQQQQPFPVMLHANSGVPSSSSQVPGPSLNPRPAASTSGVEIGVIYSENETISVQLAPEDYGKASMSRPRQRSGSGSGASWRRGRYKNYTEADLMKAVSMVVEGYSYKKTTQLTGVPCSTITDRMTKMNLSRKAKKKEDVRVLVPGMKRLSSKPTESRV